MSHHTPVDLPSRPSATSTIRPKRHNLPHGLVLVLFGMSLSFMFPNMFMGQTAGHLETFGSQASYGYYIANIVTLTAFALASRTGISFVGCRLPVIVAVGTCVVGAIGVFGVQGLMGPVPLGVFTIGSVLTSAGSGTLLLFWYELLARLSIDYAMLYYAGSGLVASLARYALLGIDSSAMVALTLALPIASGLCLLNGARQLDNLPYARGEVIEATWSFPWKPVLLLATFCFASKFTLNLVEESHKSFNVLGGVLCYGLLLLLILGRFKRFSIDLICYLALPLTLSGMLCALNNRDLAVASIVLTYTATDFISAFVVALLFDLSYRRGVNALWVFGITQACRGVGSLAANIATTGFAAQLAVHETMQIMISVLIVTVVVVFMIFTQGQGRSVTYDMHSPTTDEQPLDAEGPSLVEQCSRAARLYDLTRREEEVLRMRLEGATLREVEERLCISHNTVKSHVRRLYAKLGAADLEEAREITAQAR